MQFSANLDSQFRSFLKEYAERLKESLSSEREVFVFGHRDADGASSVAISLRILRELRSSGKWALFESFSEAYLFIKRYLGKGKKILAVDIGGMPNPPKNLFIIDHHVVEGEWNDNLLNPRTFGLSGDSYACSSTLMYALSSELGISDDNLIQAAIVGAVGDVQQSEDSGPLPIRRLSGLNEDPVREGERRGIVREFLDLNFYGKRERPLREAFLIYRSLRVPFLKEILEDIISIDSEERTWEDLSLEERSKIVEKIVIAAHDMGILQEVLSELFVYDYIFPKESHKMLRGATEFSVLINGLVRADLGSSSKKVAMKILLGNRKPEVMNLAIKMHEKAKERRRKFVRIAEERIKEDAEVSNLVYYLETSPSPEIDPGMTGAVASILSKKFLDKVVIVGVLRPLYKDLKVSIRFGPLFSGNLNAGSLMKEVAEKMGGEGGGHELSGGCNVPVKGKEDLEKFLFHLREALKARLS